MKANSNSLDAILRDTRIWRINRKSALAAETIPTGFSALDAVLPGGGWPLGALTEILIPQAGNSGLRLVLPALAKLSQTGKWLAWIVPPYIPYAPALAAEGIHLERMLIIQNTITPRMMLWALEQCLRWGVCSAALAWPTRIGMRELRRLQLAAEAGQCWGLLFRPETVLREPSPAALRIRLEPCGSILVLHICKCRGGATARSVCLNLA